jgi:hypothetical protein
MGVFSIDTVLDIDWGRADRDDSALDDSDACDPDEVEPDMKGFTYILRILYANAACVKPTIYRNRFKL